MRIKNSNKIVNAIANNFNLSPKPIINKTIEKIFKFDVSRFVNEAIKLHNYRTYVEIGVQTGKTFKMINGIRDKIAVDIKRSQELSSLRDGEYFYEMSSDEFFSKEAPSLFHEKKIDIAFIDGYHEFFQVTRDFVNVEKYIAPNGIIFIHDCNPISSKHAGEFYLGGWNGDVWKLAYLLNTRRSDLNFFTLNCDEGIGVVSGFNNSTNGFDTLEAELMKNIKELDYNFFRVNRQKYINLKSPFYWKTLLKNISDS